jgi:hypothetical protein
VGVGGWSPSYRHYLCGNPKKIGDEEKLGNGGWRRKKMWRQPAALLSRVQKTAAGAVFETGKTGPVNR